MRQVAWYRDSRAVDKSMDADWLVSASLAAESLAGTHWIRGAFQCTDTTLLDCMYYLMQLVLHL